MQPLKKLESAASHAAALPWYPVVFVVAYVLNLWVESGVNIFAITRSLAVGVLGAGSVVLLLALITRRPHMAGAATLLASAILISRGTLNLLAVLVLAVAIPVALFLWGRIRHAPPLSWPRFTRAMNVLSGLVLLVVLVGGVPRGTYPALVSDVFGGGDGTSPSAATHPNDPDIYILILDGYPGDESFSRLFVGDNSGFRRDLEARGFEVMSDTESNYTFTQGTLTSMLHMRPLHEIADLAPIMAGESEAYPLMRVTLNDNPAFDLLRSRAYRVISSSSGYEHVTLRGADEFLDDGSLNEVERHLIRFTVLQRIIDAIAPEALPDQHRQRILAGFDFFKQVATDATTGPTFAIIHVPSPHPPVVLDRQGGLLVPQPREGVFDQVPIADEGRAAYRDQLAFLNEEALAALDHLDDQVAGGQQPLVIVMSDHGAAPQSEIAAGRLSDDHYANYLAVRTPGERQPNFSDATTPVNLLSSLFNTYFGTDYPMWPDERYPAEWFGGPSGSFH